MSRWGEAMVVLGIVCIVFFVWIKSWERQFRLDHVPEGLNISSVIYAKEEFVGFGPGASETGVIVYKLSEDTATEVKRTGIEYFKRLPSKSAYNRERQPRYAQWQGRYGEWQETPILSDPDWEDPFQDRNMATTIFAPKIANYLDKYGSGIVIEPEIEREINEAISKSGSYLAYGRFGILIVIPDVRKVVYAYRG